jgi:hypothetical protein
LIVPLSSAGSKLNFLKRGYNLFRKDAGFRAASIPGGMDMTEGTDEGRGSDTSSAGKIITGTTRSVPVIFACCFEVD